MEEQKKRKAGQPTLYREEYNEQVFKLCLLGAKDKEIADFFEVSLATISNWKNEHPKFLESIKDGKTKADMEVANSLFKKATGFEREVVTVDENGKVSKRVEYHPADHRSIAFWLTNRQRDKFTERQQVEIIDTTLDRIRKKMNGIDE